MDAPYFIETTGPLDRETLRAMKAKARAIPNGWFRNSGWLLDTMTIKYQVGYSASGWGATKAPNWRAVITPAVRVLRRLRGWFA